MRTLSSAVVLGGHGFLGRWLVRELAAHGVEVTAVDRIDADDTDATTRVIGELDELDLAPVVRGADAVFHLATPAFVPPSLDDPVGDLMGSAGSTLRVLEAVRRGDRRPLVVLLSSAAVYGTAQVLPMSEDHPIEPTSPYGVAKLAAEEYLRLYIRLYGLEGVVVRPFSLYGPGQRKLVVFDLLCRLFEGEDPLVVKGRADVTRDLLYVGDAARGLRELAERAPAKGESYNLAAGRAVSLGELVDGVVTAAGVATHVQFTGEVRTGDPLRWEADIARATSLGVTPAMSLADGLAATAEWVRSTIQR